MQSLLNEKIDNPIEQVKPIATAKDTYGFVSTRNVLDVFQSKGWEVETSNFAKVRQVEKQGFQKHLVWLKNDNFGPIEGLSKSNESLPRLCLVNSHDATSSVMVFFGIMRIACLNQIIAGNVFRTFRAVHSKNVTSKLGQGIDYMTDGIPELITNIQRLQSIELDATQRATFAKAMVDLRLQGVNNVISIDYDSVERAVRPQDTFTDAYTVLNRVQEYIIRGGIHYTYSKNIHDDNGQVVDTRVVHTKTRQLASIPTQLKLNNALMHEIIKVAA